MKNELSFFLIVLLLMHSIFLYLCLDYRAIEEKSRFITSCIEYVEIDECQENAELLFGEVAE